MSGKLPAAVHPYTGVKRSRKKHQATARSKFYDSGFFRTARPQILTLVAILFSELFIRFELGDPRYLIIVLLGATIYTAHTTGSRHGLVSSMIVVVYSYYLTALTTNSVWLSLDTLQRGAVIAIAFPFVAFAVGRLKDRNDALLLREQTAREKAEESEQRLRFMAESMPQKIFTVKPNGTTDYTNPQWDEYLNGTRKKTTGVNWVVSVHPDDLKENARLWNHSLKTGEPFEFEHRLKRKDGTYVWHITRAHALRNSKGKVIMWVGSSTDIEDVRKRRQLEANAARLIKQRTQLMELNKAKDEFISLASHQLRTPATGVKQYINMVIDGYAGKISPQVRSFLEKASSSNERQLSVINDLLRVAQIDAGKVVLRKDSVDIGQLLADVINEQKAKFTARQQTVQYTKPKRASTLYVDETKLRMVIENIIDNASKYSPEGTTITVRVARAKDGVSIAIKDEGVGISEKDIRKVFDKFLRLNNPLSKDIDGSGLGLYWAKKIIELHGGTISVKSTLGKGSTFTIELPF